MIKISDYIAKRLKEVYKIKHFFIVSGGGAMHLNDSLGKYISYICNHNEQASAIAAEGYARFNQQLAVVNVTTGPGGLNCLNGVFGQWTDSVPVLYISGQVKYSTTIASCKNIALRQLGDQEVDIISVVKPLTKYAVMITNPNEIKYHLDKAIYKAMHGRFGPVWIDIPMNVQSAMIDESKLKKYDFKEDKLELPNIDKQINKLKNLFKKSKYPLIIAGHGIRLSNAKNDFLNLVNKLNIPVLTTVNGFDIIPKDNSNFMARIGTVGNRAGNFILQNSDLIISIGSRNNIRQISYNWENFAKNAKLIIVDIDKNELQKPTLKPYLKIHADAKDFIKKFTNKVNKKDFSSWNNFCNAMKNKYFPMSETKILKHKPIEPYYFINEMTKCFKDDEIVIGGNGSAFLLPFQVGEVKRNQRYIWNSGNASMGYDLPASIGACIANKKKRVVCLAGDGSIMMNLQELQTIKSYNMPVKIFVLNNNGYISIQQTQNNFFNGRLTACSIKSGVTLPDFIKIGKAFNLKTVRINTVKRMKEQIKRVLEYNGPILCEVFLNHDYIFTPKLSAKKLPDGTMISPSLEDMFPFLDRKEFEENIIKR
ncbi:MAG: thiamine pyrophosphate-binding protein [Endomicrobiaceae bacterium]|nr:thiamine pyrophosphate-binding protein [Endomicrobiaceae bacterium]